MKQIITAVKLPRFQFILDNQTDKVRFADKIKERFIDAEEIIVEDPTGLTFHYFPRFDNETIEQAKLKRPLMIPKAIVEEYNKSLLETDPPPAEQIDFDSLEVLTGQLTLWVDKSILKAEVALTEDDIVAIVGAYGQPELGKFIYEFTKNGKISDATISSQKRFSSPRTNVKTLVTELEEAKLENGSIIVDSVNHSEIRKQLANVLNGDKVVAEGKVPVVFPDDIAIEMTHYKDGQTYIAELVATSFDYFGNFSFIVKEKPEELVLDQLKFSAVNTWDNENTRYIQHVNPGDNLFLLINASGITKPFQAKLLPTDPVDMVTFAEIVGAITINPGLNVIPYTVPADISQPVAGAIIAVVNKETVEFGDSNQTTVFKTSRDLHVNYPAVVPVVPTISGPPQFGKDDASTMGIPATWSNHQVELDTKVLIWECDVPGAVLEYLDEDNHRSVQFKLPAPGTVGQIVKISLTTDGGKVDQMVELMAQN